MLDHEVTNLVLTIVLTNQLACVQFIAQPWTYYRLERTLVLPATNWLSPDYYEERPYHFPAVLCDWRIWTAPTYRVAGVQL